MEPPMSDSSQQSRSRFLIQAGLAGFAVDGRGRVAAQRTPITSISIDQGSRDTVVAFEDIDWPVEHFARRPPSGLPRGRVD
jgi:hypothetical protein